MIVTVNVWCMKTCVAFVSDYVENYQGKIAKFACEKDGSNYRINCLNTQSRNVDEMRSAHPPHPSIRDFVNVMHGQTHCV